MDESHENKVYILILHSEFVCHESAYNNEGVHLTRDALIWVSQLVTSLCFRISFSAYFLHRLSVANLSSLMHRWQVIFQSTEPLKFRGHEESLNQAYSQCFQFQLLCLLLSFDTVRYKILTVYPVPSRGTKRDGAEKDVLKQGKDILKQKMTF